MTIKSVPLFIISLFRGIFPRLELSYLKTNLAMCLKIFPGWSMLFSLVHSLFYEMMCYAIIDKQALAQVFLE